MPRLLVLVVAALGCGGAGPSPPSPAPAAPPIAATPARPPVDALPDAPPPPPPPSLGIKLDGAGGAQIVGIGFSDDGALHVAGHFRVRLAVAGRTLASGRREPGYQQVFAARIERDGTLGYLVRVGSPDFAEMTAMAVAADGTVAVVGGYDHGHGAHATHEGTLIVLGPDGKLRWERKMPTADRAWISNVAIDRAGAFYVCGGFAAATTFGTTKVTSTPGRYVPSVDAFVARYGADGTLAWVKTGGGAEDDGATAIATLPSGDVAIAGHIGASPTFSGRELVGAPAQRQLANPTRGFVAIYEPNGWLRGVSEFGAHDTMQVGMLAAEADGTLVLAADDAEDGPHAVSHPFVARFDAAATLIARRDIATIGAAMLVDRDLVTARVVDDHVAFERHDGARTKLEAGFTRSTRAKLEPIALARAADGRVAFAAVIGDFSETPLGDRRIAVSSDDIDSVVAIGAFATFGTVAALTAP